jgi:hypothetical protein
MNLSVFNFTNNYSFALVSFEKHLEYSQVADDLYNTHRQDLGQIETLIVRPPVERPIIDLQAEQSKCQMLLERFPYLSIYLLYSNNFEWHLSDNLQASLSTKKFPIDKEAFFKFCRQKEMEEFVLQSQAIYRSPNQSVFRTPSQEYTRAFLRVGNIQTRRHVLDVIFFWLLPELKDAGALLTDSWSISSISLNVGRLYGRYLQHLHKTVQEDNFHVNFLSIFYHGKREMSKETRQALLPLLYANDKKILFLVSAIKTKKSLAILQREMEQQGFLGKMNFIALYALQAEPGMTHLCELHDDLFMQKIGLANGFESWLDPPESSTVVVINERTFIPSIPIVKEIPMKKELADGSKSFFDRYMGMGALTVHRNAYFKNNTLQRHHGLFIDVSVLLQHNDFLQGIRTKINALSKNPALIIYPPHTQGETFVDRIAQMIRDRFGEIGPIHCFAELDTLAMSTQTQIKNVIKELDAEALILVVDDVLTTGNRLKIYQKCLREIPYKGQIHYLVGVARPTKKEDLNFLKRDLQYRNGSSRHTLDFIEEVFLPDWNKDSCPWCRESKLLEDIAEDKNFEDWPMLRAFIGRQILLADKAQSGLTNEVFHSLTGTVKASFAGGSIFCEKPGITEAELVTRIAAAIHHFKTEGQKMQSSVVKLGIEYPLYTIIRSDDYLGDTFNEALIKAAILRSSGAQELYAVEDGHLQRQKTMLLALLADGKLKVPEKCFFFYELFLAIRSFKLPAPKMEKDWKTILTDLQVAEPVKKGLNNVLYLMLKCYNRLVRWGKRLFNLK